MSQGAKDMLNMCWLQNEDSVSSLWELTFQKRCEDPWCNDVLLACRDGKFSEDFSGIFAQPLRLSPVTVTPVIELRN